MKRLKIYSDPMVASMGIIWGIASIVLTIFGLIILFCLFEGSFNEISIIVFWFLCCFAMIFLTIYCAPAWFSYFVVSRDGIKWVVPFSEKYEFSHEEFEYVKIAYYLHVYKIRTFLVMSRSVIPMIKLTNINQVRNSKNFIKIRITPRRYKKLIQVLPDFAKEKVELAVNGSLSQVGVDIDKKQSKKKKKRRRK